jgi:hypothetical protein
LQTGFSLGIQVFLKLINLANFWMETDIRRAINKLSPSEALFELAAGLVIPDAYESGYPPPGGKRETIQLEHISLILYCAFRSLRQASFVNFGDISPLPSATSIV